MSHRALIFGALGVGKTRIKGLLDAEDVGATWRALASCGVALTREPNGAVRVVGKGHLDEPNDVVNCGNAGTAMRLLAGAFAATPGLTVLTGDASLRRRPMGRVVEPLRHMGAQIHGRDGGLRAPLCIQGGPLQGVRHDLHIASAQVKSCLLLAGLKSGVEVYEPRASRDHSERLLRRMGANLADVDGGLRLAPSSLTAADIDVPGDISSAAFLLVAATLCEGSELILEGVGVNPTRAGVIDALLAMGADITVEPEAGDGIEPRATLTVRHAPLRGIRIDGDLALRALDELPVLAIAAAFADGESTIADAEELRVKESDRIARVVAGLRSMGASVDERPDGMVLGGGGMRGGGVIDASGDHRLAMAFTVAGLVAASGVTINNPESVSSSWPNFYLDLASLGPDGAPDEH